MKKIIPLIIAVLAIPALSVSAADGKPLFEKHCAKCHGKDGKGHTFMGKRFHAKDYTDPAVQKPLKDEAIVKAIKEGFKEKGGREVMFPTKGLSDNDVKALVQYMRSFGKK
jgi:mono/diheme cytochrome c family protein